MPLARQKRVPALILMSLVGMLAFVSLFGTYRANISAFQVELGVSVFDHGLTVISVPPLGRVSAKTHLPPLMLRVGLAGINLERLQKVLKNLENEEFMNSFTRSAQREVRWFLCRLLIYAFLGGVAGPFLVGERQRKVLLVMGLASALVFGLLVASAYATYRPAAFMHPEFEGILEAAPWMFGLIEETLFRVRSLSEQLELIAVNMDNLFKQIERLEPLGTVDGELKVVHVSDIHNNPAAIGFLSQIIETFAVNLVIDTGDITDFGTQIETEIALPIENFGIPYVFVPGNHDSPEVVARLAGLQNVTVLEEGIVDVLGLRIAGIADPSSYEAGMTVKAGEVLDEYADRLGEIIDAEKSPPHVVAVHHPRIAGRLVGRAKVILTGHTHQLSITEGADSIIINAGTTGAAGIRGLQAKKEVPYSLVLMHWGRREDGELFLHAADIIRVYHYQSGFSLERQLFEAPAPQGDPETGE